MTPQERMDKLDGLLVPLTERQKAILTGVICEAVREALQNITDAIEREKETP